MSPVFATFHTALVCLSLKPSGGRRDAFPCRAEIVDSLLVGHWLYQCLDTFYVVH